MRCSNEPIARQANKEDGCKGKFFESRFISQALFDEAALLTCACYLDLNPIRAGIADTPGESDYTSIKQRISSHRENEIPKGLFTFAGNPREPMPMGLPCTAKDYFDLVDMTVREQRHGKTGYMDDTLSPSLQRLWISKRNWHIASSEFETAFSTFVGQQHALANVCEVLSKKGTNLQSHCIKFFPLNRRHLFNFRLRIAPVRMIGISAFSQHFTYPINFLGTRYSICSHYQIFLENSRIDDGFLVD